MDSPTETNFSDFDLESGETVKILVDGKEFMYKKPDVGEELDWAPDYIDIIDEEVNGQIVKKTRQNFGKLNKCKLRNIIEAPYQKEHVKKILNLNSEFRDLSPMKRQEFLCKLNSEVMGKLITEITKVGSQTEEVKKNL